MNTVCFGRGWKPRVAAAGLGHRYIIYFQKAMLSCTEGAICSQTLTREALPTFLRFQKSLFWTIFRSFLSKEMLQNRPRKLVTYKIAVLEPLQKLFIQRNASKGPCTFFWQTWTPFSVSFEENNFPLGGTNTFWSKTMVPLRSKK